MSQNHFWLESSVAKQREQPGGRFLGKWPCLHQVPGKSTSGAQKLSSQLRANLSKAPENERETAAYVGVFGALLPQGEKAQMGIVSSVFSHRSGFAFSSVLHL